MSILGAHTGCISEYTETLNLLAGGTLGLFTGMSLLSIVEMVFWIYKSLIRALFDTRF